MESATWCRTPAAASAARRLRPEVSKNSSTALSSNEGELARSITTVVPTIASLSPSPVILLMPFLGDAATTSCPPWRRMATVLEPIRPVPPTTTIFISNLPCREGHSMSVVPQMWASRHAHYGKQPKNTIKPALGQRLIRVGQPRTSRRSSRTSAIALRTDIQRAFGMSVSCENKRRVRSADDLSASTDRRLRGARFAGTPDLGWRSPINLSEHRIESPQATEACPHGDLRHREIGLVQKPLRPLHACRLGDLNRACTEVHLEEPGQMSRTNPETIGQSLDTAVIKCTVCDEPERTFDSGACSLPCR